MGGGDYLFFEKMHVSRMFYVDWELEGQKKTLG